MPLIKRLRKNLLLELLSIIRKSLCRLLSTGGVLNLSCEMLFKLLDSCLVISSVTTFCWPYVIKVNAMRRHAHKFYNLALSSDSNLYLSFLCVRICFFFFICQVMIMFCLLGIHILIFSGVSFAFCEI